MAKFIQEFYTFLSFVEGNHIASQRPPEKIDSALYFTVLDTYNKWIDHYGKTKKIDSFLTPFKRQREITLTAGSGTLPGDYAHHRVLYKEDGTTKIDLVLDDKWAYRVNRKIGPVSADRPIARVEFNTAVPPVQKLEVLPLSLTKCKLLYFKMPDRPKYAYTVVGNRYVYNDAESVDIEFSPLLYPDLLHRVLSVIGVNLREGQLVQAMELFKSQEQRK